MRDRVFIVCGGDSLRGQSLGWLRCEDTIAVNYAAMHVPEPTYFLTADSGVIKNAATSGFWNLNSKTKTVVVINEKEHPRWESVKDFVPLFSQHVVPTRWDGAISLNKKEFATGKNTGFCALQYAVQLGYKTIFLLGVDLQRTEGRKYFYDDGDHSDSNYELFYNHYKTGLSILIKNGYRVYSCSPVSRLNQHIPFMDLKVLIPKMPFFVSHYTKDTPYQDIANNLKTSLDKWKLDYEIEGIDTLGSWRKNSNYCAWQVQKMLRRYAPRSILRVDCDAVVEQYPELFLRKGFRADIAATIWKQSKLRPQGEFMGGTMYFSNSDITRRAVDSWVRLCEAKFNHRNGDLLWDVVQREMKNGLSFYDLPMSYCRIFDYPAMGPDKVIVHYQASRKHKGLINALSIPKTKRG